MDSADRLAAPTGQPNRPMVQVLSIIMALSSTRKTSRHPLGGHGCGLAALSFKNARFNRHPRARPAMPSVARWPGRAFSLAPAYRD